MKIEGEK